MGLRRSSKVVRGQFTRQRGPKWTSPSDFISASAQQKAARRARGRATSTVRRYAPLWLGASLLGLAYGSGTLQNTGSTGSAFADGGGARYHTVYYRRCDDARAAGAAPIHVGEPGYRQALDRDRDGIACEPYFDGD